MTELQKRQNSKVSFDFPENFKHILSQLLKIHLSHHCVSVKAVSQNELGYIKLCHSRGKQGQHQNGERISGITVKNCAGYNNS